MENQIFKITTENCWFSPGMVTKITYTHVKKTTGTFIKKRTYRFEEKPTSKVIAISELEINAFIEEIFKTRLSIPDKFEMGCDGCFTQIEFGGYSGGIKMRWWSQPPKEWEKIDAITHSLISKINELDNEK